jgi:hypothetical protein
MVFFSPDQVAPHDAAGFGRWLMGHFYEHKQFITLALALTTPGSIPDYNLKQWDDDPLFVIGWLNAHQTVHAAVRQITGVSGIDLSLVDLNDDDDFLLWQNSHSIEHAQERAFFGVM